VLGSNLDRDTDYTDGSFRCFPQSFSFRGLLY
jgi:hypothetical protein